VSGYVIPHNLTAVSDNAAPTLPDPSQREVRDNPVVGDRGIPNAVLHDACAALHDGTEGMAADLPSSDPALTTTLQAALNDYHAGAVYCDSAVHNGGVSDLSEAASYMSQGNTHMQQAIAIVQNEPV
jgi:hypothetical protein